MAFNFGVKIMSERIRRALTFILLNIFFYAGHALSFDKIVMFGDSLSDNGNMYDYSKMIHKLFPSSPIYPKSPPYYQGRFTNGPVWVEYLAQFLNVPLENYAYGGAWVEPYQDSKQMVPYDLTTQVNLYLLKAATDFHKKNHLYVIWGGANDYMKGRTDAEYATSNTVSVIKKQIDWLALNGVKNFLILNLPDLGLIPYIKQQGPEAVSALTQLSQKHNDKLALMLADEMKRYPSIHIFTFDIFNYFTDVINHPEKYHLKNATDACYGGDYTLVNKTLNEEIMESLNNGKVDIVNNISLRTAYLLSNIKESDNKTCANPAEYLFWDQVHPTQTTHQALATLILKVLNENHALT